MHVTTRRLKRLGYLVAALLGVALWGPQRAWAATAPGTVLSSSTAATYQDLAGSSYATTSNTVTTTVANAPSLTVSTPTGQSVTAGMIVVDTFTLTNVGNAAGNFNVTSDATFGGTASSTTLVGYVLGGATVTCTTASPCALTTAVTGLQAKLAALPATGINGTIAVGVEYTVSAGAGNASVNQTIQTSLGATLTYPIVGGTAAATSASVTSTPTDTVAPDARLDIAASASQPTSGALNITWTITANNGGAFAASDSLAAKTLLSGSAPGGVAVVTQLSTAAGIALTGTPTCVLNGAMSGATATMYYTATAVTPNAANWSTTNPGATTKWLACYIHGGASGAELPSASAGSAGAGVVSTPQVTLTFVTLPSTSSTLGIATNIANGWANGAVWATGTYPVLGPGIALGTADGAGVALNTATTEGNTTSAAGTVPPGGASNTSASQAYVASTNSTNTGTAAYVGADSTTQGLWHAASTPWTPYVYGSDGYTVLGGTSANPAYATVTVGGSYTYGAWQALGTTTDVRAPYGSFASASQVAAEDWCAAACNPTSGGSAGVVPFTIDVNITDGAAHQFSLYLLQWDAGAVQDAILVTDVTHGANLLFHVFNAFNNTYNPMYARWNISGHVRFTLYWPQSTANAPTFSAYFFDPVTRSAVTSSNSGSYVTTDTLTQGNWAPGSGGDGNEFYGSSVHPAYAAGCCVNYGQLPFVWALPTSDVRALYIQRGATGRIAYQLYGGTFGFTLPMTDGNTHVVALYFLDWDQTTRSEKVYVADAATGAIFDARSLSGFHNGTYVVWNLKGSIVFYFVQTSNGNNATYSGIFWGSRVPALTLVDAVSPTGNQPPGTLLTYTGTLANVGAASALNSYVSTAIPANTDFQIGSPVATLTGTGVTYAVSYSNNGGGSYAYTPVSAGGGAASGYDRNVTNVRWTFTGALTQGAGANTGTVGMTVVIR